MCALSRGGAIRELSNDRASERETTLDFVYTACHVSFFFRGEDRKNNRERRKGEKNERLIFIVPPTCCLFLSLSRRLFSRSRACDNVQESSETVSTDPRGAEGRRKRSEEAVYTASRARARSNCLAGANLLGLGELFQGWKRTAVD